MPFRMPAVPLPWGQVWTGMVRPVSAQDRDIDLFMQGLSVDDNDIHSSRRARHSQSWRRWGLSVWNFHAWRSDEGTRMLRLIPSAGDACNTEEDTEKRLGDVPVPRDWSAD